MWQNIFRIGLVGVFVSALCCATPILGIGLAALGVSLAISLDLIVIPMLLIFLGVTVLAWYRVGKGTS